MDAKSDLLKEAIADAKAVKETALANAKIALEEAFAPRIQSMLSTKLAEELDEEEESLEAAAADMSAAEVEPAPAEPVSEEEMPMDDGEVSDDEPAEDSLNIDMSEGDYSIEEEDSSVAEDLELEAIIRELEEDLNEEDLTEEEIHEEDAVDAATEADLNMEELNIDEIIESILSEEELDEEEIPENQRMKDADEDPGDVHSESEMPTEGMKGNKDKKVKVDELEEELTEAYDTIESLRDTINEVNLLNAKLLYTNKLFRNFELSEDQKMKVIENFDRAGTTREVKLVFTTLAENFTVPTKKRKVVKEGAASKPAGTTTAPTKQIINEGNELANRWKKLAGLLD